MATVSKEDVIDAIAEESEERLELLSDYWKGLNEENGTSPEQYVAHSLACADMLYKAKAYQDTLDWLEAIGEEIIKAEGEESDAYVAFAEDEDLETMRMNALDRSGLEEEEEEDFGDDDE